MTADLSRLLNALGLVAVDTVLVLAFADQLWFRDLPCPICIRNSFSLKNSSSRLVSNVVRFSFCIGFTSQVLFLYLPAQKGMIRDQDRVFIST